MPTGYIKREQIFSALYDLLRTVKPPQEVCSPGSDPQWILTSRDLQQWDDVPAANQPALFVVQGTQQGIEPVPGLSQWRLRATAIVYYKTLGISDPDVPKDSLANKFIDAFDFTINPHAGQRQTLGNLVYHCSINGDVAFDSGLTDGQAVVLIPIVILVGDFGIKRHY